MPTEEEMRQIDQQMRPPRGQQRKKTEMFTEEEMARIDQQMAPPKKPPSVASDIGSQVAKSLGETGAAVGSLAGGLADYLYPLAGTGLDYLSRETGFPHPREWWQNVEDYYGEAKTAPGQAAKYMTDAAQFFLPVGQAGKYVDETKKASSAAIPKVKGWAQDLGSWIANRGFAKTGEKVTSAGQSISRLPGYAKDTARSTASAAYKRPLTTLGVETGISGAAGAVGHQYKDDAWYKRVLAETGTGLTLGLAPAAIKTAGKQTWRLAKYIPSVNAAANRASEFTKKAQESRLLAPAAQKAQRVLQQHAVDTSDMMHLKGEAREREFNRRVLQAAEGRPLKDASPSGVDVNEITPGANIPLSLQTESPGVANLWKMAGSGNAPSATAFRSLMDRMETDGQRAVRNAFSGDELPEAASNYIKAMDQEARNIIEQDYERVYANVRKWAQEIQASDPLTNARLITENSKKAMNEVQGFIQRARAIESEFHNMIPGEIKAPLANSRVVVNDEFASLPETKKHEFPPKVWQIYGRHLLGEAEAPKPAVPSGQRSYGLGRSEVSGTVTDVRNKITGHSSTIKELRGLYSELREFERLSRSHGNYNEARIAKNIAGSINQDIYSAEVPEHAREVVKKAVNFSADLNDRFTDTIIYDLVGRKKTGGHKTKPDMFLAKVFSGGDQKSASNFKQLKEATDYSGTDFSERMKSNMELLDVTENYLFRDFLHRSGAVDLSTGVVDQAKIRDWVSKNAFVLNHAPRLKSQIDDLARAGDVSVIDEAKAAYDLDLKQSKAALLIEKDPVSVIGNIVEQKSAPEAAKQIASIMKKLDQDPSGEAVEGMKSALFDYLRKRSDISGRYAPAESGLPTLSGDKLSEAFGERNVGILISRVFGPGEERKVKQGINTLRKLDVLRHAEAQGKDVYIDTLSSNVSFVTRFIGAASGSRVAQAIGVAPNIQIPEEFAKRMQNMAKILSKGDVAEALIKKALVDDEVWRELMTMNIKKDVIANLPKIRNFMAVIAAEHGIDFTDEDQEQEQQ